VLPEYSRMLVILAGYLEVKKCYRIEIYQEEIFFIAANGHPVEIF